MWISTQFVCTWIYKTVCLHDINMVSSFIFSWFVYKCKHIHTQSVCLHITIYTVLSQFVYICKYSNSQFVYICKYLNSQFVYKRKYIHSLSVYTFVCLHTVRWHVWKYTLIQVLGMYYTYTVSFDMTYTHGLVAFDKYTRCVYL